MHALTYADLRCSTSPQYNSHRFPASAFLQVAVSKAPAHSISKPQIFASGRFRYSPKTSVPVVGSPLPYSDLPQRGVIELLQLCILGFGLLEDGNVGVCILPQRKEILIGVFC